MGGPGTPGILGGRVTCTGTMSLGTTKLLEAMGHVSTPGVLFPVGFAKLLQST